MQFVVTAADRKKCRSLHYLEYFSKKAVFLRTSPALFMTCLIAPPTLGRISVLLVRMNEHLLAAWEALLAVTTGRQLEASCRSRVTHV